MTRKLCLTNCFKLLFSIKMSLTNVQELINIKKSTKTKNGLICFQLNYVANFFFFAIFERNNFLLCCWQFQWRWEFVTFCIYFKREKTYKPLTNIWIAKEHQPNIKRGLCYLIVCSLFGFSIIRIRRET